MKKLTSLKSGTMYKIMNVCFVIALVIAIVIEIVDGNMDLVQSIKTYPISYAFVFTFAVIGVLFGILRKFGVDE